MKKVSIFIGAICLTFGSCKIDHTKSVEFGKSIIDSMDRLMIQALKNEIPKDQVNPQMIALSDKLDSVKLLLPPKDTLELYNYRVDAVNKMIDFTIELNHQAERGGSKDFQ